MVNRSDIIREFRDKHSLTTNDSRIICESLFEILNEHIVENGEDVYIYGLGTFRHKHTKERLVKHPSTGEMVTVESRDKIQFLPVGSWMN